mmetsp:Transcript_23629/g.59920  ORF Transcript_23629/g.59920 Transcript_23629/m.59920 type:complete len:183 (-) Transcript_23629:33-581(-)
MARDGLTAAELLSRSGGKPSERAQLPPVAVGIGWAVSARPSTTSARGSPSRELSRPRSREADGYGDGAGMLAGSRAMAHGRPPLPSGSPGSAARAQSPLASPVGSYIARARSPLATPTSNYIASRADSPPHGARPLSPQRPLPLQFAASPSGSAIDSGAPQLRASSRASSPVSVVIPSVRPT